MKLLDRQKGLLAAARGTLHDWAVAREEKIPLKFIVRRTILFKVSKFMTGFNPNPALTRIRVRVDGLGSKSPWVRVENLDPDPARGHPRWTHWNVEVVEELSRINIDWCMFGPLPRWLVVSPAGNLIRPVSGNGNSVGFPNFDYTTKPKMQCIPRLNLFMRHSRPRHA